MIFVRTSQALTVCAPLCSYLLFGVYLLVYAWSFSTCGLMLCVCLPVRLKYATHALSTDAARAAVEAGFVIELLKVCKLHSSNSACVAAVFTALRAVACNDEAVQQISAGGGLAMAEKHLTTHAGDANVCRAAAALLRNLAGNDQVKTSICSGGGLELLLGAVGTHPNDSVLAEHVIATLAAMALRVPANCERVMASGGARVLTGAMRRFPNAVPLQRQGCLAVRNLVGRCPHLREALLEDDMEGLLRHAGKWPGAVDAAFAALRDLGLDAEMLTIDSATGEVKRGVEMFGETKSNFRPVFDDDPAADAARDRAMAAAAQSPAALGFNM